LLTLTRQVLENMNSLGAGAWTGPLARGDFNVVEAHLEALRESPAEFALTHEALNRGAVCCRRMPPGCWPNWIKFQQEKK